MISIIRSFKEKTVYKLNTNTILPIKRPLTSSKKKRQKQNKLYSCFEDWIL